MQYRKRRHAKTINKNDQKVRRGQAERDRPALDVRYPSVDRLWVRLDFYTKEGAQLSQEVKDLRSRDSLDLSTPCPGGCGDGEMDVEGKVADMVRRREESATSSARCARPAYGDASSVCGCELRCQINIAYRPA